MLGEAFENITFSASVRIRRDPKAAFDLGRFTFRGADGGCVASLAPGAVSGAGIGPLAGNSSREAVGDLDGGLAPRGAFVAALERLSEGVCAAEAPPNSVWVDELSVAALDLAWGTFEGLEVEGVVLHAADAQVFLGNYVVPIEHAVVLYAGWFSAAD